MDAVTKRVSVDKVIEILSAYHEYLGNKHAFTHRRFEVEQSDTLPMFYPIVWNDSNGRYNIAQVMASQSDSGFTDVYFNENLEEKGLCGKNILENLLSWMNHDMD